MSQENVDLVRAMYEAFMQGDLGTALRYFDADIRWSTPPDMPEGLDVRHGREGARASLAEWLDMWSDYQFELQEIADYGERIVVFGWQQGRGKGSGIEVSEEIISVWTLRDGLVVEQQMFRDRAQALAAAGVTADTAAEPTQP
jgi:ketosteroid isomerase-like protein